MLTVPDTAAAAEDAILLTGEDRVTDKRKRWNEGEREREKKDIIQSRGNRCRTLRRILIPQVEYTYIPIYVGVALDRRTLRRLPIFSFTFRRSGWIPEARPHRSMNPERRDKI